MSKTIKFEIVTPEKVVLKELILQATIPTASGEITVLPDHIPLVSILKSGVLEIKKEDGSIEVMSVSGGFIEVLHDKIVILADTAERAAELDEARITMARQQAEETKKSAKFRDDVEFTDLSVRIEKELARDRALLDINRENSEDFVRARLARQLYRAKNPTEICAFKCMDGRIHIPVVTKTPLGIIKPYRNIGGYFDLGWPFLGEDLTAWVKYGVSKGHKSLIMVTYHYSKGDKHRGCAGFNYDHEAAFKFTINFHKQVNRLFGENNQVVFPVVVGLETDTDALIFHPQDPTSDKIFLCSEETSSQSDHLLEIIGNLYPDMDQIVRHDLLPLIQGNIAHIKEIKES
ncbi:MAG: ATP synthase F1 subunit epsilon, partial [Candidatus Falkowbacteria bacterium]|nr:ATP synthase F1 subunit epsilon [Candidatus Falkowbacteria bacterium]